MNARVTTSESNGLKVFELANDEVRIRVIPELGSKISGLQDLKTGRQWLWTPPDAAGFRPHVPGLRFDEANLGGADECIPTIAQCRWRDKELPDHGEVWAEKWSLDEAALAKNQIVTEVYLPISPLRLRRTISLNFRDVLLNYQLENLSDDSYEYIWAFHPDFAIEEGDNLSLPAGCTQFQTEVALGCPLGPRGSAWRWPDPIDGISLDQLDFGAYSPAAIKFYTSPLSDGYAAIRNQLTGAEMLFLFDPSSHNTLGIWMNRGGWEGHHHLAVEPTNGAPDSLEAAVTKWGRFASISARATCEWSLRIVLSAAQTTRGTADMEAPIL